MAFMPFFVMLAPVWRLNGKFVPLLVPQHHFEITERENMMIATQPKKSKTLLTAAGQDLMTDVSTYADIIGIRRRVFFSPQVLNAVMDTPAFPKENEEILDRMLKVLANLSITLSYKQTEDIVPFDMLMAIGSRDETGTPVGCKFAAVILSDDSVRVITDSEVTSDNDISRDNVKKVQALRRKLHEIDVKLPSLPL